MKIWTTTLLILCGLASAFGQGYLNTVQLPASAITHKPESAALGINSDVYISLPASATVKQFRSDGELIGEIKSVRTPSGELALIRPGVIYSDAAGKLYIHDAGTGKIVVRNRDGSGFSFGAKGSKPGQFDQVKGLVVDSQGFIYVLNAGRKQIDIFQADGAYLSWISGGFDPFVDPISLSINGANEICVLEAKGPSVIMFNTYGNQVNMHRNFTSWKDVNIKSPIALASLNNGDFFILDEVNGAITHFSRAGAVLGSFGSKGMAGAGSFANPIALTASPADPLRLGILDQASSSVQVFSISSESEKQKPLTKSMQIQESRSGRAISTALCASSSGTRYAIPAANNKLITVHADTSSREISAIQPGFKGISDLAIDQNDQLYVLDRQGKEVWVFSAEGVLVRKLGQDIPRKLKDPCSIAVRRDGLLVCDKNSADIHLWTSDGIYQKALVTKDNSILKSPIKIQTDSKGQIYILDDKANCIYRAGSGGYPLSMVTLKARSPKAGGTPGKIVDFVIDPLDQIYLYNSGTSQIEVYQWDVEPELRFSGGHSGEGTNSLNDVSSIVLDPLNYQLFCLSKNGTSQKVLQFLVKPSSPDAAVTFNAAEGELILVFERPSSALIDGCGLITKTANGKDSIAAGPESSMLRLNESSLTDLELRYYDFVSLSKSHFSEPAIRFANYPGLAERLLKAGKYDEALVAIQLGAEAFRNSTGVTNYLSELLCGAAAELESIAETGKALRYVKEAVKLNPDNPKVKEQARAVYTTCFTDWALRDEMGEILGETNEALARKSLRPIAISAIAEACVKLREIPNEISLNNAVYLGKRMMEWEPSNPVYSASLGNSYFSLYRHYELSGAPSLKLKTAAEEAQKYLSQAVRSLGESGKPWYPELLSLLEVLNASGKYDEVQKLAVQTLNTSMTTIPPSYVPAYRLELAKAYSAQDKHYEAAEEYRLVVKDLPENRSVKDRLGRALIAGGELEEARSIYQGLLADGGNHYEYVAQIGMLELKKGNYAEAAFQLEKAVNLQPNDLSYHRSLAGAYEGASNFKKAIEHYVLAVKHEDALLERASRRIFTLSELEKQKESWQSCLFRLGELYERTGDYEQAVSTFQKITQTNAANASAHFALGRASLKAGLVYSAVNAFNEACVLEPGNKTYSLERDGALKMRTEVGRNQTPLSIIELFAEPVYPSLYPNYSEDGSLPVGELVIANNSDAPITPSSITVFIKGAMSAPSAVKSPAMVGFSNTRIALSALFDASILEGTENRTLQMEVVVTYNYKGKSQSIKTNRSFVLHGRNSITWADKRRLAAFVAPTVKEFIEYDKLSDRAFKQAPSYKLNPLILQAMQAYTLLYGQNFVYSPDPVVNYATASLNPDKLDYVQYPAETLVRKSGDCDDLVVLLCAILENAGVETAYIDVPGHVFMAFHPGISAKELGLSGLEAEDVVVQAGKVWIPLETTLLGKHGFMTAWKRGAERYYSELKAGKYPELVPMCAARKLYAPSSYIPDSFQEEPQWNSTVESHYNAQLEELLGKINQNLIRTLESRYQSEPGNVHVKTRYAALLVKIGQEDRAERLLTEALELSPQNPVILNNLGNINLLKGNAPKAIHFYTLAAERDVKDAEILINLCKAYLISGDKQLARSSWERAVSLDAEMSYLYDYLKADIQ